MKKKTYFGAISALVLTLSVTARAEPTISFIEEIQATASVKAGNWSRRKDKNNRIRFELAIRPTGTNLTYPYEFLMFFDEEFDRLKDGQWAAPIPFPIAPSHLDRLDLKLTVKKYGFKAKQVGFGFVDFIPYVIESATDSHPHRDVQIPVTREMTERLLRGEKAEVRKGFADGSELIVRFVPAPTQQVTLSELMARYEKGCHRYGDHMRGGLPLGSPQAVYGLTEKLAHIRAVLLENDRTLQVSDCTDRKNLR